MQVQDLSLELGCQIPWEGMLGDPKAGFRAYTCEGTTWGNLEGTRRYWLPESQCSSPLKLTGEGNGTLLQYSCLGNKYLGWRSLGGLQSMGFQSWTQLSN